MNYYWQHFISPPMMTETARRAEFFLDRRLPIRKTKPASVFSASNERSEWVVNLYQN
jgi:hypothetical protein